MPFIVSERGRLITLILVMVSCVTLSVFAAIYELYSAAYDDHVEQLQLSVHSQKEMIAAVGRFDAKNSQDDHPGGALGGTLSQIVDAHLHYKLPGESSEFILVEQKDDLSSVILLHNNQETLFTDQYLLGGNYIPAPDWFSGVNLTIKHSPLGSLHLNGILAVYDHVLINGHQFLLVSKVNEAEIRQPFINAGLITLAIASLLILVGAVIITNQVNPMISELNNQLAFSRALLDTAVNPIITVDSKGKILSFNQATLAIFGYQREQLIDQPISRLIPDFDRADADENTGVCSDGKELTVQLSVGSTRIDNRIINVYIVTDITKRKRAELLVLETKSRTEAIINTVQDGMITTDRWGTIQSLNPATEMIFDYSEGELIGKNVDVILPDIDQQYVLGKSVLAQGRKKDSSTFPMEVSVNDYYIDGELYLTGMVRDVSERIAAEEELRRYREKLEEMVSSATSEINAIVQTAVNAVVSIDGEGIVHTFNPAAERIFGWAANEVIGKNVALLIPDMDEATHGHFIQRYIETREAHIVGIGREVLALRKNGSKFAAHLAVGHRDLNNDEHLFVGYISDITAQKQTEAELIQAKNKAEEAVKVKSNFLANMSHEIRTPMNAVIGFSEILLQDNNLTKENHQHVLTILSSGRNLLSIINDILDLSKIEAGGIELENICFHLSNAINDSLRTVELVASEKGLKLSCDVSPALPKLVLGDPVRLRQVMINLVGNAIKFTQQGYVKVQIEATKEPNEILFSISDTGIGMSQDELANVFEAFSQADASINRHFGGTGLGTTISKQIVKLMGGRIWVESEKGKGSTFYFTALLKEAEKSASCLFGNSDYIQTDYHSPRAFNVLLAEDIQANAVLGILRLEQQNHQVTWVENGQKAVDEARTGNYDLILMDVQMPEMDGLMATRLIREELDERIKNMPIIALTASVMMEDLKLCKEAGINEVIAKPIDFPKLFSTMESLVPDYAGTNNSEFSPTKISIQNQIDFSLLDELIDYRKGVDTWIDEIIYAKALLDFAKERKGDAKHIGELLENSSDNLSACKAKIHALKGVSGSLFITRVAEVSERLDESLRNEKIEQAFKNIRELDLALISAVEIISRLQIPQDACAEKKQINLDRIKTIIEQIDLALEELNPDAVQPHIQELLQYLISKDVAPVQRAIDHFDFSDAKKELLILAERLNISI